MKTQTNTTFLSLLALKSFNISESIFLWVPLNVGLTFQLG